MRSSWSDPQSSQSLVWLTVLSFSIFDYETQNQFEFAIDHLVMSMSRVVSCAVSKSYFWWPVCSLDKTVNLCSSSFCTPSTNLPVILVSLHVPLLHSNPLRWKDNVTHESIFLMIKCLKWTEVISWVTNSTDGKSYLPPVRGRLQLIQFPKHLGLSLLFYLHASWPWKIYQYVAG